MCVFVCVRERKKRKRKRKRERKYYSEGEDAVELGVELGEVLEQL